MHKKEFYPLVRRLLESEDFIYFAEEDIRGVGRGPRKPDFVALKGNWFLIGEIKSPAESPLLPSWRSEQPYDSENMRIVRRRVQEMERKGRVSPGVGGHTIIIMGQIPEYIMLMGKKWLPPEPVEGKEILGAYAFPAQWQKQVEEAVRFFEIKVLQRIGNSEIQVLVLGKRKKRNVC